jgi:hypothetical protein
MSIPDIDVRSFLCNTFLTISRRRFHMSRHGYEELKKFIEQHKEWLKKELPDCAYGVSAADELGGRLKIALWPRKITPTVAAKIAEFKAVAGAACWDVDVRETEAVTAF